MDIAFPDADDVNNNIVVALYDYNGKTISEITNIVNQEFGAGDLLVFENHEDEIIVSTIGVPTLSSLQITVETTRFF